MTLIGLASPRDECNNPLKDKIADIWDEKCVRFHSASYSHLVGNENQTQLGL